MPILKQPNIRLLVKAERLGTTRYHIACMGGAGLPLISPNHTAIKHTQITWFMELFCVSGE